MDIPYLDEPSIQNFIERALQEDVGSGDHTSNGCIPPGTRREAELIIKDEGIIAGLSLAEIIFNHISPDFKLEMFKQDGDRVTDGEIGFHVEGSVHDILKGERLVLNCLQRMSGIATYTSRLNDLIKGTGAKLLDTRKTTPNFRLAEKWAVIIGGGINHRFGLFDMVLIKDNHVDYAGSPEKALEQMKVYLQENNLSLKVEIEVRNLDELASVLKVGGVDRVLLDNMLPSDMRAAVDMVNGKFETEASGGISEKNIREIAETGVDYISVGALTHSYRSLDMSLKATR